jgi:nicotinamidase-related amidase
MLLTLEESQLLLVDYQSRLMPAIFEGPQVLANALKLARMAKLLEVPVWVTEENAPSLGATVAELQALLTQAGGKTFSKMQFSAIEEGLGELLRPQAPSQSAPKGNARSLPKHLQKQSAVAERNAIVMAGCETHVCLLQTALDLLEDEFEVWVVTDASSSRTERNRDAAFDRLATAGAELVTTEMVAFEWLRSAEHPAFKDVLALVKQN